MNGTKKKMSPAHSSFPRPDPIILLAEDDDGHAELTINALRTAGLSYEILHFHDGKEVLDFFAGKSKGAKAVKGFSYLLILDLHLPQTDGFSILGYLKEHPTFRKIPVLIFSTEDDPIIIERCYALGCNAYVTKPITYPALAEKMKKLSIGLSAIEWSRL